MQNGQCGQVWPGEATLVDDLRCQREPGHPGAHVVDIGDVQATRRYWWVQWTGERGVNSYPALTTRS